MSILASDIVIYSSQNMPQDDLTVAGGDINSGIRVVFDDIVTTGLISAVSDSASDTGNLIVFGRDSVGIVSSDTFQLNGTTPVNGTQVFERILSCSTSTVSVGTVAVSGSALIGNIYPTESGFLRPFYGATANAIGDADKTLYEKVFIKNNSTTNALLNATVEEIGSGLYSIMQFGLEKSQNYTESVANRTVAPTGVTSYGSGVSGVTDTNIAPLNAQGTWLQLTLNAGTPASNSFYQLQIAGGTT